MIFPLIQVPLLSLAAAACWLPGSPMQSASAGLFSSVVASGAYSYASEMMAQPVTQPAKTPGTKPVIQPSGTPPTPAPIKAPPAGAAPRTLPAVPIAAPSISVTSADSLLTLLETADANLRTLTADIQYDKVDGVTGDRQTRRGKLFFQNSLPPKVTTDVETFDDAASAADGAKGRRTFSVRFDSLQLGSRREEEEQLFVFDGEWLIEVTPKNKQIIKRQVTRPGSNFDPLKIGEGPLPLPIGQKKADMLSRFDVTLLKDIEELEGEDQEETARFRRFVSGSYQLKLVPKADTPEAEKFSEIRMWYREGDSVEAAGSPTSRRLLPRMARTMAPRSGNVAVVQMINVKTNGPIDPAMMGTDVAGTDWEVVVEALPGRPGEGEMNIKVVK